MAVNLKPRSRLRFAEYVSAEGVEFFDLLDVPLIPVQADDLRHETTDGERIDQLAFKYYGDPILWWVIAVANNMEDLPTELNGRMTLRIPSPRFVLQQLFAQR